MIGGKNQPRSQNTEKEFLEGGLGVVIPSDVTEASTKMKRWCLGQENASVWFYKG